MVSLRFTNFVFGLMFILLDSAVNTHQAMEKILVAAGNGIEMAGEGPLTTQKDIFYAVPAPAEGKSGKFEGRKMKRMILDKDQGKSTAGEASKITGAAQSIGNKDKGKRKLKIECKLISHSSIHHLHRDAKAKIGSFMALGMDVQSMVKPNDSYNPANRVEKEKKLVEGYAIDKMVNLMNKDYQGAGKRRNKPPINNHEPLGRGH